MPLLAFREQRFHPDLALVHGFLVSKGLLVALHSFRSSFPVRILFFFFYLYLHPEDPSYCQTHGASHKLSKEFFNRLVRFLTHHLNRACTVLYIYLTCAKTYVKIKVSKPLAFHE
jgi:hypothetical protein